MAPIGTRSLALPRNATRRNTMEGEFDQRRRDEGKKMTSTAVVLNRRLVAASAMEGELRRGGDGRWGRGGETVRGATSPDDGVPTF